MGAPSCSSHFNQTCKGTVLEASQVLEEHGCLVKEELKSELSLPYVLFKGA